MNSRDLGVTLGGSLGGGITGVLGLFFRGDFVALSSSLANDDFRLGGDRVLDQLLLLGDVDGVCRKRQKVSF
jgi:hypothetical protein